MRETFRKEERLCSRTEIRRLFHEGRSVTSRPFRANWVIGPPGPGSPAQVVIIVPKALLPKATDRNLVKRRIRESYRKNKFTLYEFLAAGQRQIRFSISYTTKEILSFSEIKEKIILLLRRLMEDVEKTSG